MLFYPQATKLLCYPWFRHQLHMTQTLCLFSTPHRLSFLSRQGSRSSWPSGRSSHDGRQIATAESLVITWLCSEPVTLWGTQFSLSLPQTGQEKNPPPELHSPSSISGSWVTLGLCYVAPSPCSLVFITPSCLGMNERLTMSMRTEGSEMMLRMNKPTHSVV